MKLVIVESPTKARTLSRYLGKGYEVEASMGHVRDLPKNPKNRFGVDIEHDFAPEYVVVPEKEEVVKKLRAEAEKAKEIYLSMDPDREGEAIAFHVKALIGGDEKFKRVVFHQITKSAIEQAFDSPRAIDSNLVDAQQARRVLDRLVGYSLSPLLWKKVRVGLSAGRVQSVAVRLIVDREREIEAFVPEEYWEIGVDLAKELGDAKTIFTAWLQKVEGEKAKVTDKAQADEIVSDLKVAIYRVFEVVKKQVYKRPFPPFTTSTLQQSGANVLRFTAKRTMRLAQQLYEMGHITYHRTDSVHLAPEAVEAARDQIKARYGERYLPEKPRMYKVKSKLAQEAHEAIRPTNVRVESESLDIKAKWERDRRSLYDLIYKRFIASQMSDAIYDQTTIDVEGQKKEGKKYLLRATGSIRKFDGWRRLYKRVAEDRELPEVQEGEKLKFVKVQAEQKFTEPPPRYSDATLVKALEERGIGRPSTYAPTISTIVARRYVEYEDRRLKPTPVGIATNDFLVSNFDKAVDYDFTAEMEEDLDKIAQGTRKWVPVIREFWKPFDQKVMTVEKNSKRVTVAAETTGKKCPECGEGEEVIRIGKYGRFLACSRFPTCEYRAKLVQKLEGVECPEDGGDVVIKQTRKGKMFYGCSNYPNCKWASWRKPSP